jgi:hypothetical protein
MAYRLWIEETDKRVWHWAVRRLGGLRYIAACGWEVHARHALVWPQKPHEAGPPHGERCHTCAAAEEQVVADGARPSN